MTAIDDRHALNVRREAESLLNALMRETDSLIKMGAPCMEQAKQSFALSMQISAGLVSDDIRALAAILDDANSVRSAS